MHLFNDFFFFFFFVTGDSSWIIEVTLLTHKHFFGAFDKYTVTYSLLIICSLLDFYTLFYFCVSGVDSWFEEVKLSLHMYPFPRCTDTLLSSGYLIVPYSLYIHCILMLSFQLFSCLRCGFEDGR